MPLDCEINKVCGKPIGAVDAVNLLGMKTCQELIDKCSNNGNDDHCDCMYYAIFGGLGAQ